MRYVNRLCFGLILALVPLSGCGTSEPEQAPAAQTPPPAVEQVAPAAAPVQATAAETSPATSPAAAASPAPQSAPTKAAPAPASTQATPPDVAVLKATMGNVRFPHKDHAVTRKVPCATCHHPSRPEKPATAPQQACGACHTSTAVPPMKTKLQAAFHNPTATAGICIDCHKTEAAKGSKAPVKCFDCHKKENG